MNLSEYYENRAKLERYHGHLTKREKIIRRCKAKFTRRDYDLLKECDIKGIAYDGVKVQTSPVNQIEEALLRAESDTLKEWAIAEGKCKEFRAKIRELEEQTEGLDIVIGGLKKWQRDLIEMRYRDGLSLRRIGMAMHMSKSNTHRELDRVEKMITRRLEDE